MSAILEVHLTQRLAIIEAVRAGARGLQGLRGNDGVPGAGLAIGGTVESADLLPDTAAVGEAWLVETTGHLWVRRDDDLVPWVDWYAPVTTADVASAIEAAIEAALEGIEGRLVPDAAGQAIGSLPQVGDVGGTNKWVAL